MKKLLMFIMAVLPLAASAHTIPVPHSHHGVFHGWETTLIITLVIAGSIFLFKYLQNSAKKKNADN